MTFKQYFHRKQLLNSLNQALSCCSIGDNEAHSAMLGGVAI